MTKEEIPRALRTNARCLYNGAEYTITACYLFADKSTRELKYSAILLDKCGRSTISVPLESVHIIESEIQ